MTYIKRAAEDTITRISNMFPVLLVTGPRQVGKTTLLQRLAEMQQELGIKVRPIAYKIIVPSVGWTGMEVV